MSITTIALICLLLGLATCVTINLYRWRKGKPIYGSIKDATIVRTNVSGGPYKEKWWVQLFYQPQYGMTAAIEDGRLITIPGFLFIPPFLPQYRASKLDIPLSRIELVTTKPTMLNVCIQIYYRDQDGKKARFYLYMRNPREFLEMLPNVEQESELKG